MATVTFYRRGTPIRNSSGKVTGYERGEKVSYDYNSNRRATLTSAGAVYSTKRTKDKSGKITIEPKSKAQIYSEIEDLKNKQLQADYEKAQAKAEADFLAQQKAQEQAELEAEQMGRYEELKRDPEARVNLVNSLYPERVSEFREQTEARGIKLPEKEYAPNFKDREFWDVTDPNWFSNQGKAIKRGSSALAQAESDIINTVSQVVTLGKYKPFAEREFTANADIVGQKGAYLLEKASNNPLTTASIITGGVGLVKGGVALAGGSGLRVAVGTATGSLGGKGIAGTLIRGANTLIASKGVGAGVETGIEAGTLTNREAEVLRTKEFKEAQRVAFDRQKSEGTFGAYDFIAPFGDKRIAGSVEQIGQEISLLLPTSRSYKSYLREELENRGFQGDRLEAGVSGGNKSRIARGSGELAGLITLSAGSEVTGRFTQRSFSNYVGSKGYTLAGSFGKSATITGLSVAPAGFFEGYGQQLLQQSARAEKSDYGEALKYGGVGSVTAFTLGGLIGGSANSGKAKLQKASEFVAYTTDPYEKIGDKTADLFQKTIGKGSNKVFLNARTITFSPSFTNTNTNQFSPNKVGKGFNANFVPSFTNTITPVPTNTTIPVNTPAIEEPSNIINFVNEPTPSPVDTPVSVDEPTIIPPDTYNFVDNSVFTNTNTNVNTNVPTNTNIFTNTPVFTTNIKIPPFPPIPLTLGGGGGGGGGRRGSRGRKVKQTKRPASLIGLTFGYGEVNVGQTFSGLGVRR